VKLDFRTRYRIVTDEFNGYGIEVKYWWWPFWEDYPMSFSTLEQAEKEVRLKVKLRRMKKGAGRVVKDLGYGDGL